jgi:putative addiction module component (TIGR02574 family)
MSSDELLAEALRLPRDERARVAEELLSSLEEPADDVAAAWADELERRSRERLRAGSRWCPGTPFARTS